MTLEKFLAALPEIADQSWHLNKLGEIRNAEDCCPMTALAYHKGAAPSDFHSLDYWAASDVLGTSIDVRCYLAHAADNVCHNERQAELRQKLLTILGIQDEPGQP